MTGKVEETLGTRDLYREVGDSAFPRQSALRPPSPQSVCPRSSTPYDRRIKSDQGSVRGGTWVDRRSPVPAQMVDRGSLLWRDERGQTRVSDSQKSRLDGGGMAGRVS